MCVPWYHRLCDKHVDEGCNTLLYLRTVFTTAVYTYGDLGLEIRTLSANVTESAWIEVKRTVNIGSVSNADYLVAENLV